MHFSGCCDLNHRVFVDEPYELDRARWTKCAGAGVNALFEEILRLVAGMQ
jgi:hypothetical protein